MAGDLGSATAASNASTSTGGVTLRWSPPELLDPERFGAKRDGPTKKSDVYSMGMAIYEVSSYQSKSGRSIEVVLGSYRQDPILRVHGACDAAQNHRRGATEETHFRHHPGLHRGIMGDDDGLLGGRPRQAASSRPRFWYAEERCGAVETQVRRTCGPR